MPTGFIHQPRPAKKTATIRGVVRPTYYSKIEPDHEITKEIKRYLNRLP